MPRKNCRTHVRNRRNFRLNKDTRWVSIYDLVQSCEDVAGWNKRVVTQRTAEAMEEAGEAARLYAQDGTWLGWRRTIQSLGSKPSVAMLTFSTMEAVANSKDPHLSRGQRLQVEKYIAWPMIGDTKAVCVRPRISDADRWRAEALLGSAA